MTTAYLGLGSNLGDRHAMLAAALAFLAEHVRVTRASSVYETAPWGRTDQPSFLNCCVVIETTVDAVALLRLAKDIERRLGRVTAEHWGPRAIDVDLLLFDDERIATPDLAVPHPRLLERAFVLVPLAEIAPDAAIAGTTLSVRAALAALARTPNDVVKSGPPIETPPGAAR